MQIVVQHFHHATCKSVRLFSKYFVFQVVCIKRYQNENEQWRPDI